MTDLPAQPTLHVVVVNYRTAGMTRDTIEHLQASGIHDRELVIWLVDNGSRDDSPQQLQAAFPGIRHITSQHNLGFAGGNNLALAEIASHDNDGDRHNTLVLLLNSDVQVEPDAVQQCVTFMDQHPEAGVVGPRVLLPDGSLDLACRRGFPTPVNAFWKLSGLAKRFPDNPRFAGYNLTYLPEDQTAEVDSVGGAFMLVRLAAIDEVGLLDDRFFMYGEDLDWSYRIKAAGWRIWYYPEARVVHLKSASARRQSRRMIYEFYRAMWLFHAKHYAQRTPVLINGLVMIGIVMRGIAALVLNGFRSTERKRFA